MLGTEQVNVTVTKNIHSHATADVPTTNKLITDSDLFAKLAVPRRVKNFPELFCNSKVHYSV